MDKGITLAGDGRYDGRVLVPTIVPILSWKPVLD